MKKKEYMASTQEKTFRITPALSLNEREEIERELASYNQLCEEWLQLQLEGPSDKPLIQAARLHGIEARLRSLTPEVRAELLKRLDTYMVLENPVLPERRSSVIDVANSHVGKRSLLVRKLEKMLQTTAKVAEAAAVVAMPVAGVVAEVPNEFFQQYDITVVNGFITTTNRVNIRNNPSTRSSQVGTTEPGQQYKVVGKTIGEDGYDWYLLENNSWIRQDVVNDSNVLIGMTPNNAEVNETSTSPRERQKFEEYGIAVFPEAPQMKSNDGELEVYFSEGYFSAETNNIQGLNVSSDVVQKAKNYLFERAISAVNTDTANRYKIKVGIGSEVILSPFVQNNTSVNKKDGKEISGSLNRVVQYVVSFEEFEAIVALFRDEPDKAREYLEGLGLDSSVIPEDTSDFPEHVGLYATRFAIGIGYFLPDGTLVVINHPLRFRSQERNNPNLVNQIEDSVSALSVALERALNFPGGGKVGFSRNASAKTDPDTIFDIFGCYNGVCLSGNQAITPIAVEQE